MAGRSRLHSPRGCPANSFAGVAPASRPFRERFRKPSNASPAKPSSRKAPAAPTPACTRSRRSAASALAAPVPAANLHRALNRILPAAIRVLSVEQVPDSFHARHSARSKTYEYRIFERRPERRIRPTPGQPAIERICSPFLAPFVWDCRWPLSLDAMQQAAQLLLGTHDFTSMAASDPDRSQRDPDEDTAPHQLTKINPIKTITQADWTRPPHPEQA